MNPPIFILRVKMLIFSLIILNCMLGCENIQIVGLTKKILKKFITSKYSN